MLLLDFIDRLQQQRYSTFSYAKLENTHKKKKKFKKGSPPFLQVIEMQSDALECEKCVYLCAYFNLFMGFLYAKPLTIHFDSGSVYCPNVAIMFVRMRGMDIYKYLSPLRCAQKVLPLSHAKCICLFIDIIIALNVDVYMHIHHTRSDWWQKKCL